MSLYCNIFSHQGETYEIVSAINASMFHDSRGQVDQKLLGLYVHEFKANRVVQRGLKFLILKEIEDAVIDEQQ
jgi:hypothetical protein